MVEKGLHFGHQTKDWNPKMAPYIYTKCNGIYIIDLLYTHSCLERVKMVLRDAAKKGKMFLFVGTKRQAAASIKYHANRCNSFYINSKWLGGLLTNWQTVSGMIKTLKNLTANEKTKESLPKKEAALLEKQRQKLEKIIGGITDMTQLPDVVIIIGAVEEINAVRECKKLNIPIVSILDTNCDPRVATWGVPANDDSVSSIEYILQHFSEAIIQGKEFIT